MIIKKINFKYFVIIICNLLFFLSNKTIYSQQNIANQISIITNEERNFILNTDTNKVEDVLFDVWLKEPNKVVTYNTLYLKRGKNTNNENIKYVSYYYLSLYYKNRLSKFETAISYADSAFTAAKKVGIPSKLIKVLNLKGNSEFQRGSYQNALEVYLQAQKMAKEFNLYEEEIYSIGHIGHIKKELKEYKEGIELYNEILQLLTLEKYKSINSYNGAYTNAINVLSICHRELGNTQKAIELCKEGLSFINKLDITTTTKMDKAMLLSNMGRAYTFQGDYKTALNNLYLAQTIFSSENITKNHIYFHNQLFIAEVLNNQHQYKEALVTLEETIAQAKGEIYSDIFLDICDLAVELSNKIKNNEKELNYSRLRNKISDSIHTENIRTRKLFNKELKKKNHELSSDNSLQSKRLGRTKIIIIVLLISLLGIVIVYVYNHLKNKKKFTELLDKIEHIEQNKSSAQLSISDEKAAKILLKLESLEQKGFFLQKDCSLHKTATKLKTNTTYLSKIINSYKHKTFKEYINEIRIAFILHQIKENPRFRHYTIKAIAEETGYKSINTLNQAFKKQTQLSLSYYIKQFNVKS
ncbi:AraC family transcriptional regulator [Tenacibaculum agarivorans]|uniref:AraC family transcriptional regulator n=1 Tax=Tenacibaculum agarivorans TaxID=1908389 RepID=UPI00094BA2C5|nr:AraC family transcriptional regulator [Tenacibaculum agarivorans]